MTRRRKRTAVCLAAAAVAAGLLAGCAPAGSGLETTGGTVSTIATDTKPSNQETTAPVDTTPELTLPDPIGTGTASLREVTQLRLHNAARGWADNFSASFGPFALANDPRQLEEILSRINTIGVSAEMPEGCDEAFFADYRLMLIPRQSNSGSVRYSADIRFEAERITVSLTARMPEMGTMDMADWLVLVPLSREKYPEGVEIDLLPTGGTSGNTDPLVTK